MAEENNNLWVFGYGSLMWRPGFDFLGQSMAKIYGYHRSLCVYSWVHRGSRENPGLVLGLDRGGSCIGMAFEVAQAKKGQVLDYLRKREQVTAVYLERMVSVYLLDGQQKIKQKVNGITYVADCSHVQYSGSLSLAHRLEMVRGRSGISGSNDDYIRNTVRQLGGMNIRDNELSWLADRLS